jgi:hypothetical protein
LTPGKGSASPRTALYNAVNDMLPSFLIHLIFLNTNTKPKHFWWEI